MSLILGYLLTVSSPQTAHRLPTLTGVPQSSITYSQDQIYEVDVSKVPILAIYPDQSTIIESLLALGASESEISTLLNIAKHESMYNPLAKNPTSSASGLFQFTSDTWAYLECGDNVWDINQQNACALKEVRKGNAYNVWYAWWD